MSALDSIDLRLLAALQSDAGRSNQALAEAVSVSPATAHRRIRRLRAEGFIEKIVALLSPRRLKAAGVPALQAVVEITLDQQAAERLDAFEARALSEVAVQQCYRVSPGPDFVLVVAVTDMEAYAALGRRLFASDANVRNVRAFFVVERGRFGSELPLPAPGASATSSPA